MNISKTPSFHRSKIIVFACNASSLVIPCPFPDCYSPLVLVSQAYWKRHHVHRGATCQTEMLFHSMYN
ncbi:hypothetical protein GH733_013987, partial [Mirounga leonina]